MRQLIRYGLVGVANNAILYCAYLIITYMGISPKSAMSAMYMAGVLIGFVGHRKWTFAHEGGLLGSGARFGIAHLMGYLINYFMLYLFVDRLGYPHQWIQAAAIFVVAVFLFVTFKYFVFPQSAHVRISQ